MTRSDQIEQLALALAKAQGAIEGALKDSTNPYFRSSYADLASVWAAIRRPLSDNGLAVVQPVAVDGAHVTVTTLLMHESGQWISSDLTMAAQRQLKDGGGWEKIDTPQAIGSVITYARRYALQSMIGVAPEDDDAEAAQGRGGAQPANQRPAAQPARPNAQQRGTQAAADQVADAKLRTLVQDALAKLLLQFREIDAESQYGEILGAYGYVKAEEVPSDRELASRIVNDLKLRLQDLKKA